MLWSDFLQKQDQILSSVGGAGSSDAALPPGYIASFLSDAVPEGWLKLDGSVIEISANPVLYALFGDRYNGGLDELNTRANAASLAPVMTSNTAPAGYSASASSVYGAGYEAYNAFDGTTGGTDGWIATRGVYTGWLRIDLPSAVGLTDYRITARGYTGSAPRDWTVQGSTDGTNWVTLDTRSGIGAWAVGEARSYELDASQLAATYSKFRLNVTAVVSNDSYLAIGEWQINGGTPILLQPPASGSFRVPRLTAAPADLPGAVWCVKAG